VSDQPTIATPAVNIDVLWAIDPAHSQRSQSTVTPMNSADQTGAKYSLVNGRPQGAQSVAVVSMSGVLTKFGTYYWPQGSMAVAAAKIKSAADDEGIGSIIFVIDSPGGTVAGSGDLADAVRQAAAKKPVYAYVEDLCCSAAYRVASQATEIHANRPEAIVGSIGTYMVIYEASRLFQNAGIDTHVFGTGKHKGAGVLGTKISDDHKAAWQSLVDEIQQSFATDVGAGRRMTPAQVETLADGRVWTATNALQVKLIDAVSSFGDLVGRAASAPAKRKGRSMSAEAKDDAPRGAIPATLAELEAALPKADAGFILRQLKSGATVVDAKSAYADERMAEMAAREEALKAKEDAAEKREKDLAAKEAAGKGKTSGLKVVRDPAANEEAQGAGGSAEDEFFSLVNAKVKGGTPRSKAVADVARENKELHERMLEEAPRVSRDQRRA
jgi:signal peptide peptidase SppA